MTLMGKRRNRQKSVKFRLLPKQTRTLEAVANRWYRKRDDAHNSIHSVATPIVIYFSAAVVLLARTDCLKAKEKA